MNTLIVVVGPTGVGKTETCLRIAEHFKVPIINADSRQLFKELPIGTAAPTLDEQVRVKHYFVGTHHIGDYYSAALFENDVMQLLSCMFASEGSKGLALMSGGSMMYVDAVCNGIDAIPTIDGETRQAVKKEFELNGLDFLLERLKELDPDYYSIVDKNNYRRVIHAVEICTMTGKTYSSFRLKKRKVRPFKVLKIGLNRPREELYSRINARVENMCNNGFIEEARSVYHLRSENALNTVGYKEMFEYFDGLVTLKQAIEKIQNNTRRYARKQMTWYRKAEDIKWFHPDNIEEIINYITTYS